MRATLLGLVLVITGCQETHHCAAGLFGGSCEQTLGDGGGMDAGADAASEDDANIDAGPCGMPCPTGQVCYEGGDAGMAHCVDCLVDDQCRGGDAGVADSGLLGAPYCIDFECRLACTDDDDCGPTGACQPDGDCSEFSRSQGDCMRCDTDANCTSPLRCVGFANAGHPNAYCLGNDDGIACNERRRFTSVLSATASVDGATADDYCVPSGVTCEAVLSALTACETSDDCGVIDGAPTGTCLGSTICTYTCNTLHGDNDCPPGMLCSSTTGACRI